PTRAAARARWPGAAAATPWRQCCRCSTRLPPRAMRHCSTPGRAARCGWSLPMTDMPARLRMQDLAVVIPALNEALRIREVVEGALARCPRVIVVDDGSDDGTGELIADLPVTVLRHPRRMGKGASLRSGFAEALRQGAKAVATMDGDGQHSAADIPRMIDSANRHPGCVIVGARLRKRGCQPWYRRLGNDFGDWGISWACGFRMVDTQSGQRLYPAEACAMTDVPGEGFVFEA